jgi:DNA-binding CsgD family transcriptional regulator
MAEDVVHAIRIAGDEIGAERLKGYVAPVGREREIVIAAIVGLHPGAVDADTFDRVRRPVENEDIGLGVGVAGHQIAGEGLEGNDIAVRRDRGGIAAAIGILAQGLRLPKGAARLVASLAAGNDLKSFAKTEGITIHTARFHLRTALTRTGTKSQAELVRLAVQLLRDFALMARDLTAPD